MAGAHQHLFVQTVRDFFPEFFSNATILEIGSCDINGSIRDLFSDCIYTGADIMNGPGVDVACRGEDLEFRSGIHDLVISCQCFEHNQHWVSTFANMTRMLRAGGLSIVSCASVGMFEHGTSRMFPSSSLTSSDQHSSNYYRNLTEYDFQKTTLLDHFDDYLFSYSSVSCDLYFIGVKKGDLAASNRFGALKEQLRSAICKIDGIVEPVARRRQAARIRSAFNRVLMSILGNSPLYYNAQYLRFKLNKLRRKSFRLL